MSQDELLFFQERISHTFSSSAKITGDKVVMHGADAYEQQDIRDGMDRIIMEAASEFACDDAEYDWTIEDNKVIVGRILARAYSD